MSMSKEYIVLTNLFECKLDLKTQILVQLQSDASLAEVSPLINASACFFDTTFLFVTFL